MNCNKCGTALAGDASITVGYPSRAAYVYTIFHCAKEGIYWLQQYDTDAWNGEGIEVVCMLGRVPPIRQELCEEGETVTDLQC